MQIEDHRTYSATIQAIRFSHRRIPSANSLTNLKKWNYRQNLQKIFFRTIVTKIAWTSATVKTQLMVWPIIINRLKECKMKMMKLRNQAVTTQTKDINKTFSCKWRGKPSNKPDKPNKTLSEDSNKEPGRNNSKPIEDNNREPDENNKKCDVKSNKGEDSSKECLKCKDSRENKCSKTKEEMPKEWGNSKGRIFRPTIALCHCSVMVMKGWISSLIWMYIDQSLKVTLGKWSPHNFQIMGFRKVSCKGSTLIITQDRSNSARFVSWK